MTERQTCQMPIRTQTGLGWCGKPAVDYIIAPANVYPQIHPPGERVWLCAECWDYMHHDDSEQGGENYESNGLEGDEF